VFGYIVRRIIAAFLVVVITSMCVFALFFLGPSNPADAICQRSGRCTAARQAALEHELGLDQSVVSQYGAFVKGLFVDREIQMGATYHCDAPCLGISYISRQEVRKEMIDKFPVTIAVAVGGSIIFLTVGVTMGALAARWRGSITDRSLVTGSLMMSSVPEYVICLTAWIYLVNEWGIFKDGDSYIPLTQDPKAWFGDSADPSRPVVRSLAEEAARVVRTRVVNPRWIEAMQRHGYKGAFEMAATVDYLFGYDATAKVVDDWMYERVTAAYVADPNVRKFFERSNPWALKSIAERLLEAVERQMWDASDDAIATLRQAVLEAEGWEESR